VSFGAKSEFIVSGLPLVRIPFKCLPNRIPVVAKGLLAIGPLSPFGIGSISRFALGHSIIAQFGIDIAEGRGMPV